MTKGHFDRLIDVPKVIASGGGLVFCSKAAAETLTREGVKKELCAKIRQPVPARINLLASL
jgi:hypothetical protein